MNNDIISIGLFIDGGYYAKVNQALEETLQSRINVAALFSFIKEKVAQLEQDKEKNCLITESHFYRGRYKAYDAQKKNLLYSERRFEDSLIENDVVFHYKHLREIEKDGKTTVIERESMCGSPSKHTRLRFTANLIMWCLLQVMPTTKCSYVS